MTWEINSEGNPTYIGADHCTRSGAEALAKRFEDYWAARGVEVRTKLGYTVARTKGGSEPIWFSPRAQRCDG
jgi:hypothetical protein